MDLKDLSGKNYMIEHVDVRPLYVELPAARYCAPSRIDPRIPYYTYTCNYTREDQCDFMTLFEEIDMIGAAIVELEKHDDGLIERLYTGWRGRFDAVLPRHIEALRGEDLSGYSDAELEKALINH